MSIILAPAPREVKPAATITTLPLIDFYPEVEVDATFDASFALWMEEEQADDDQWSDAYADEMAARHADDELTARIADGVMPW